MFSDQTADHCVMKAKLSPYRLVGNNIGNAISAPLISILLPFLLKMVLHSEIQDLNTDLMHEKIVHVGGEKRGKLHVHAPDLNVTPERSHPSDYF